MTQKQLIDQFCEFRGKCTTDDVVALNFAYEMLAPHWVSVEEELPPRDTFFNISNIKNEDIEKYGLKDRELDTSISCLVAICGGMLGLANYNYKEKAWSTACCDEVTHWMPLPSVEHLKEKEL